jgi:methionine synthase II (cobalamin-independent)
MRITKHQLRRIIREERRKLIREQVEEGLYRSMYDGVWNYIELETAAGPVDLTDRNVAESFAKALEDIAGELRDEMKPRDPSEFVTLRDPNKNRSR